MGLFFLSQFKLKNMCLTATHRRVKIAKEDIVCYKLLDSKLKSPFKGFKYKLNKLTVSNLDIPDEDKDIYKGLHAYQNISSANSDIKGIRLFFGIITDVYKAIIPKGSRYYLGKHNDIVSNQMIIKELIK